jgi:type II secretory pathway pseudopilin PulG
MPASARRAFTLLETLLVAGALVAIAAVAFPLYAPLLERQEFDSAVDEAVAQCEEARAAAQTRGVAVEVVVTEGGARLEARVVDLLEAAERPRGDGPVSSVDGMEGALRGSAAARQRKGELERDARARATRADSTGERAARAGGTGAGTLVAMLALAPSVRVSLETPAAADERPEFNAEPEGRVALFLPDGSATAARGFWVAAGARAARVEIDPLLGRAVRRDSAPAPRRERPREDE